MEASQSAFESYEHPERVIQSVGLVKPKAGVFIDTIRYILVVCTSHSVSLLGLSFEDHPSETANAQKVEPPAPSKDPSSARKHIKLFVTEMQASTDGVQLSDICGTENGRIFCKGNDGCLYEILYQASEGWFSNRCALRNITNPKLSNLVPNFIQGKERQSLDFVAVDSARRVLYTLHKGTEIEVHHLTTQDSSKPPVKIARAKDICRHANMICPNTPLLQPSEFHITWMTPVSTEESRTIHLVAVTSKGVRLYFTTQRTGWRALGSYGSSLATSDNSAPSCLELIYVRPPPPPGQTQSVEGGMSVMQTQQSMSTGTSSSTEYAPHQPVMDGVNHAFYANGIFLAASQYSLEPTGSLDNILGVTRAIPSVDASRSSGVANISLSSTGVQAGPTDLADTATDLIVQGATWAIAEISKGSQRLPKDERLHPLALQMIQPPRVFVVLTSSGLFTLIEQRPIDTLKGLLQVGTLYDQTVHEFFKRFGQAQSCAMSLAIASRNSLVTLAPESYVLGQDQSDSITQWLSQDVVSHAWRIFFDFGGYPRYEPPPYPSQPASDGKVTLSGRHDGVAIYLTRLLHSFWNQKITKKQHVPGDGEGQHPNLPASALSGPQQELRSLYTFLETNSQLFNLGHGPSSGSGAARGTLTRSAGIEGDQVANNAERESFDALKQLLSRSLEALSFVLLLIDYRLPSLVQRCKPEVQEGLLNLTFAELTTTRKGRDIGRALVEAIIDLQISSQASIDVVADVLQERCGGFCNADDVRLYKALECVRKAWEANKANNPVGKTESLRESLRLLNRATTHLPIEKLESICSDYRELQFYHGAIELPLNCASTWDRNHISHQYRVDGMPPDDRRSKTYELSIKCYELVLLTLDAVDSACNSETTRKAKESGQSEVIRRVEEQRANAYAQAQTSTDPLFHIAMYDWLLANNKTDELLQIRSPYVEEYLRSEPVTLERCQLLCLWYVSVGHSFSAAQLYAGVAQSTELDISLDDRVEFLSKASSNAKSTLQTNSHELIEFINDIDEKLEVASVQIEIFKAIQESLEIDDENKSALISILNESLLDITTLFREFAEPLQMHEIKLLIYHVSDYRDEELVRQAWEALIAEAHNQTSTLPETRHERVAAAVIELGHRFYPSDVAFPVDMLMDMLLRYTYEQLTSNSGLSIPPAWVAKTMLLARVPPQLIFDVMVCIFDTKREPYHTPQGQLFVLSDLAHLARIWVDEILGLAAPSLGIKDLLLGFSARRLDDTLSGLVLSLSQLEGHSSHIHGISTPEKIAASFKLTQELIRRSF